MIKHEDDLWRMFGGKDHTLSGQLRQPFSIVFEALRDYSTLHQDRPERVAKAKKRKGEVPKVKKAIGQTKLADTSRFYLLIGRERQVCVDQSRLIKVGKAMRDRELAVQYLGTTP